MPTKKSGRSKKLKVTAVKPTAVQPTAVTPTAVKRNVELTRGQPRDVADVQDLVAMDVEQGIGRYFAATDGFIPLPGFTESGPISNDRYTAQMWEYRGVHSAAFQGISATGNPVVVRGVTVVDGRDSNDPKFHRYIDWLEVMGQIGLTSTARPAVAELPP